MEPRNLRKNGSQISSRTSSIVSLDPLSISLSLDGSDPLSHFAEIDPLTKIASEYVSVFFRIVYLSH